MMIMMEHPTISVVAVLAMLVGACSDGHPPSVATVDAGGISPAASEQDAGSLPRGSTAGADPLRLPLVSLLALPTGFEGQLVTVRGFASVGFERDALYMSEVDYLNGMDGIFMRFPEALRAESLTLDRRYVIVNGVFTRLRHGHAGMFVGEIGVRSIGPVSNPRCPVADTGVPDAPCR
jgi:hypothetical protein